ncbi:MAG: AraC family transcriptional regulator [Bacteroidota bacterium]
MDIQNLLRSLHLSLLSVDECIAPNWNFQKVISPFTRLYLVKSGEGNIIHNHQKIALKEGGMYLIPSFTLCNYSSETFLGHFYIHFIPQLSGGTDLFKLLNFKYELTATESDFQLMKRMLELNPGRELVHIDPDKYCSEDLVPQTPASAPVQQIACCMETQGILLQLFSRFISIEDQTVTKPKFHPNSAIRQVIEYIQMNLAKQHNLSELADMCHLSKDYFSRLFLKTMGIRPIDYINRKRIEEAQLQLVATNEPIEHIALEVGIDNFSYFNRLFKKYACNTPGEYRKLHKLV